MSQDVFGKEIAVRIRGIDTPELNDKREEIRNIAIKAKEELALKRAVAKDY